MFLEIIIFVMSFIKSKIIIILEKIFKNIIKAVVMKTG